MLVQVLVVSAALAVQVVLLLHRPPLRLYHVGLAGKPIIIKTEVLELNNVGVSEDTNVYNVDGRLWY
jgi:hypothetical protein